MSNIPVPNISKERIDKIYLPRVQQMIQNGKNMNNQLRILEGFDSKTKLYENFSVVGAATNADVSNTNSSINTRNTSLNSRATNENVKRETLLRTEELNQLANDSLIDQYQKLSNLQSDIFTKERLIEENLYHSEMNERYIRILTGSIIFVLLMGIFYVYQQYSPMDSGRFQWILLSILILYVVYLSYQLNLFYLKESINSLFQSDTYTGLSKHIKKSTEVKVEDPTDQSWIKQNCDCPTDTSTETPSSPTRGDEELPTGFYYQDGSSPNQVIIPDNTQQIAGEYEDQIHYTDVNYNISGYSSDQSPQDGNLVGTNVYTRGL